ncbi:unnamed protein product [Symbiodinium necroappetens]|uniref:Uncharacterized protein n=1 Tax=Symbiodinium necroappetens TaxID=1628268 RepID=A0A812JQ27_9DINO|nr:unnamed protein product [Symbiodinium necroappetens]
MAPRLLAVAYDAGHHTVVSPAAFRIATPILDGSSGGPTSGLIPTFAARRSRAVQSTWEGRRSAPKAGRWKSTVMATAAESPGHGIVANTVHTSSAKTTLLWPGILLMTRRRSTSVVQRCRQGSKLMEALRRSKRS